MINQPLNFSQEGRSVRKGTNYSKSFWIAFIVYVLLSYFFAGWGLFSSVVTGFITTKLSFFVMRQFYGTNLWKYRFDTNFIVELSKDNFIDKIKIFVQKHYGILHKEGDFFFIKLGKRFTLRNFYLGYNKIALLDELLVPCVIQIKLVETSKCLEVNLNYKDNLNPFYEHPKKYESAFINYFKRIDKMIVKHLTQP
jgi:hypothetical protein